MNILNIFQMYVDNDCTFGRFVTRYSWSNQKYAMAVGIDGLRKKK